MTAVGLPPRGYRFGSPYLVLRSWPRSRQLAAVTLVGCVVGTSIAMFWQQQGAFDSVSYLWLTAQLITVGIALVAVVVRCAQLSVTHIGIRWGFEGMSFIARSENISRCHIYPDCVGVEMHKGGAWYLSGADWQPFEQFSDALEQATIPVVLSEKEKAPLRSRWQSYGYALDSMLVLCLLVQLARIVLFL